MKPRMRTRARTRVAKRDTPWTVLAAATLPRGRAVANPLIGEDPHGRIAVVDMGMRAMTSAEGLALVEKSDGALLVFDALGDEDAALLRTAKFTQFTIDGCDLKFAASYPLPAAPWLHIQEIPPPEPETIDVPALMSAVSLVLPDVTVLAGTSVISKAEDGSEERFVLGVVLEPDSVDSQGDTVAADEIRRAAHGYMERFGNVGLQHQTFVNDKVKILESYVTPVAFTFGDQIIKAGTWLMGFRVTDDAIWSAIKEGTLTGLSMGGTGMRVPV